MTPIAIAPAGTGTLSLTGLVETSIAVGAALVLDQDLLTMTDTIDLLERAEGNVTSLATMTGTVSESVTGTVIEGTVATDHHLRIVANARRRQSQRRN